MIHTISFKSWQSNSKTPIFFMKELKWFNVPYKQISLFQKSKILRMKILEKFERLKNISRRTIIELNFHDVMKYLEWNHSCFPEILNVSPW